MASENAVSAEIQTDGKKFLVGPVDNKFKLLIKCGAAEIKLWNYTFRFIAIVGSGEDALVANNETGEQIVVDHDSKFEVTSYARKERFVWEIGSLDEEAVLKKGGVIEIGFSKVQSRTKPGKAELTFESVIQGTTQTQTLELEKSVDTPGFIYFYSTTKERNTSIWPADETIIGGETVTLNWLVNKLENLELQKDDSIVSSGLTSPEGKEEFGDIYQDASFVLVGTDPEGSTRKSPPVKVKVLQARWHPWTKTVKREQLQPVLLFSANNQSIYAVLKGADGEASLFQAENPFWPWTSMGQTVPPQYVGSPGVYADDKLWFVGGSEIDPDICSSRVAYFDPKSRTWTILESAPWKARMGHAVLELQGKIWVMGGCDQNRNALKDVWTMDLQTQKWGDRPASELPWSARCMFTCARFGEEIWAYGGFKEPFSGEFLPDLCIYTQNKWSSSRLMDEVKLGSKTIAACLQSFNGNLHLIGKTSVSTIDAFHYRLVNRAQGKWEAFTTEGLKGWGEDQNLSYQLVNYKDKFLVAKAMGYEKRNTSLRIYVPESTGRFSAVL